jgi:hypothetical protein
MDGMDSKVELEQSTSFPGLKLAWVFTRHFLPNTVATLVRYGISGGKKKEWPLGYSLVNSWLSLGMNLLSGAHDRVASVAREKPEKVLNFSLISVELDS